MLRIFPGCRREPGRVEEGEVGGVPEAGPVGDRALRDRGGEAVGVADDPVGEHSPAAATGDPHASGIDVAAL